MAEARLTGSRIRGYRIDKGLRQAALAKQCDISPSYLNLIEHNRRKIGGALLTSIADALEVDASVLSGGAEVALASAIGAAADASPDTGAERARADELASRFPGWARLIEAQYRETRRLEQVVEQLGDRLTHDPYLSASMHNVLSSVTAIRSASAILARGEDVEPEWQERFHRNIYEDSQRLTEATETLVAYLDSENSQSAKATLPQDEIDAWLNEANWRIDALEADPDASIGEVIAASPQLVSTASRRLATQFLHRYADDVRAVPMPELIAAIGGDPFEPTALAHRFQVELPRIFRRLAALDVGALEGDRDERFGLVACDASGALIFKKPIDGFDMPRYSAACPIWPIFQSLGRPMQPLAQAVTMAGRDVHSYDTLSISTMTYPTGFDGPPVVEAWMLIRSLSPLSQDGDARRIGAACRVCAKVDCVARREPSVFALENAAASLTA